MIKRDYYLNRLVSKKENGLIKIITGIRRCGKSYLLFELYKSYLNSIGIDDTHIIQIQLDKKSFEDYRNPNRLYEYILEKIKKNHKLFIKKNAPTGIRNLDPDSVYDEFGGELP